MGETRTVGRTKGMAAGMVCVAGMAALITVVFDAGPAPGQAPKTREDAGATNGRWPFRSWAYAKAYVFNFFPVRRGVQLGILEDGRWNPKITLTKPVPKSVAAQVIANVTATKGTFRPSACPFFPRHAFVFFDARDKPVATVDICFQCGDLIVSPDFEKSWDAKHGYSVSKADWKAYEAALKSYRTIVSGLGMPIRAPGQRH